MPDEPHGSITIVCNFCGKHDQEVRRQFASAWKGQKRTIWICNEWVFIRITIMVRDDPEWFTARADDGSSIAAGSGGDLPRLHGSVFRRPLTS